MTSTSIKSFATTFLVLASVLQQCAGLHYDPSKTYSYVYETDIEVNDVNSPKTSRPYKDVGVKLFINFQLSTLYKNAEVQLFKLVVTSAKAASILRPDLQTDLKGTLTLPAYFQVKGDEVDRLHFVAKDSTMSRNIKKGIVGLFQVQGEAGDRMEVDVSGECKAVYSVPGPGKVTKVKADCQNLHIAGQFSTANKALGVSVYNKATMQYSMVDDVIQDVVGTHRTITYLNIRTVLNTGATSNQKMTLASTSASKHTQAGSIGEGLEAASKESDSALDVSLLPSEEEAQQCTHGCEAPKTLVPLISEDLKPERMASLTSAKAFTRLLHSFRNSGKQTLSEAFILPESYYIVPQLIDVATAAQTEASRSAILDLLTFEDEANIAYPQRFLFSAAFSSHPNTGLIREIMAVLDKPVPSPELKQSLLLSLGGIVYTFCQVPEQCKDKVVEEFQLMLASGLSSCQEEACTLMYVRALGNAGLPATVPVILPFAENTKSSMVASTAIQALRRINKRFLGKEVKESLLRVFNQNSATYDSSVRVAALEVLLDLDPSPRVVRNVLLAVLDQSNHEFSTYILRLLRDSVSTNAALRSTMQQVLTEPAFHNYNSLSQRGKSSVITSSLARMRDVNSTYNLFFENSKSGVMKSSGMIVNLEGKAVRQPFMKFGIYAHGLEALTGDTVDTPADGSEAPEATAGMTFTFLDVLLANVEFFKGTSGLMSAVWNAPSEMTSALQANLLLQDHSSRIHLSNGLVLSSTVTGVLSMDLSGQISISLWNKNCEALIRNSGALYIESSLQLMSKAFKVGMKVTGEGQSNIDYTSMADFYEMPLKLCMEMKRPDFNFVQKTHKFERIQRLKTYKSGTSMRSRVAGESYFLNHANSEMCRVMLK